MRNVLQSRLVFFGLAAILLWVKSYYIYSIEFNLDIQNSTQQFLLLINPISSVLVFLGLALFARGRRAGFWLLSIYIFMSLLLYSNIVFYRFNTDFITLPVLTQTSNFASLGGSIANLVAWHDLLYFVDIVLLIIVFSKVKVTWPKTRIKTWQTVAIIVIGLTVFQYNLDRAEQDRPQLLERTFDRNYIVKYLGLYNFAVYDAIQNIQTSTQRVMADSDDITEIENYTKNKFAEPNPEMFGVGEGKNIIKIHLESFQSFLIDFELHGEEVTPFINSLVNDSSEDFTYFENFFHQTEQGKTADAELILDTSLFGLPQGAAFVTKGNNTYHPLAAVLNQQQDYTSAVFHGDGKSFWNRDEIYKRLAIDEFFHEDYYDMSEDKIIGYGLKDKPFFEESMPLLESLDKPFYAHMMTLTHHHPYLIDEEDATIDPADTGDVSVDRYFQTARYLDEAMEQFFADLKASGLYDDSIIMIYGDHYGISDNRNRVQALEKVLEKEITPFDSAHLQRVPFMIKVPGVKGKGTVDNYAGQIDVMPTLLHILGIKAQDYIQFGTDMFSEGHKQYVAFRNGDFITPTYSLVGESYYDNETGEEIPVTEEMETTKETVHYELELSDKVLFGDLLRFYTPTEDWEPVDSSEYFYSK